MTRDMERTLARYDGTAGKAIAEQEERERDSQRNRWLEAAANLEAIQRILDRLAPKPLRRVWLPEEWREVK